MSFYDQFVGVADLASIAGSLVLGVLFGIGLGNFLLWLRRAEEIHDPLLDRPFLQLLSRVVFWVASFGVIIYFGYLAIAGFIDGDPLWPRTLARAATGEVFVCAITIGIWLQARRQPAHTDADVDKPEDPS